MTTTSSDRRRIMLIEDDDDLRTTLVQLLLDEDLEAEGHPNGEEALARLDLVDPDLAIVDLRLPGMSGFDVVAAIRARSDIPIIILTAQTASSDVVAGLEAGADDYMTKPFVIDELLARLRANLRRSPSGPDEGRTLTVGDLVVAPLAGEVSIDGEPVHVTRTELRLLAVLAGSSGEIVSREQLLARVWHYDYLGDSRMVDAHVHRLRLKIERDPAEPQRLLTVRGSGYRLVPYDEASNDE
jgi:two-component system response regulator MtrA